jgi:hypothetical protein
MERDRDSGIIIAASSRFFGKKMKVPAEQNRAVAAL